MFRSVLARAGVALSLSTIVLGALAAPTSAAVHTHWVDDDHTAGDGPAACDSATFHTIQGAINASHAGDKVFVCPGTYPEQLDITVPNLTVQANPTRTAKIVEPAAVAGPVQVAIESDGVKFTGFRISVPASSTDSADSANCGSLEAAIFATGQNEEITSNTIKATGDDTLSGDCGYYYGIIVATMTESSGGVYGPDTSYIAHNRVVDFKEGGILVAGDRSARIYSNNVRFVHQNDPATCLLTPVLGVQPTENLLFPCSEPLAVNPPPIMGDVPIFQGIGIGSIMALADIRANTVYSIFDLAVCVAGPCTAFLGEGVATF